MTQFTISCAVGLLRLMTSDEIMTSSLKKVINIDQNSHSLTAIFSFQIVDRIRLGSRRELVANCVHTTDADATQLDSLVASASAVCIRLYEASPETPTAAWYLYSARERIPSDPLYPS